ncbi:putative RNA-directed DNA polymerase from transposon X-element [Trichonephila inaurata madagascariensis]|uniref:Putative RNA-directed DNA polymerase from transposon X-element n=1 Tax=Trichonephila inaurata madagascariensis TaxID=2747483 RepID=A0A8X7CAM6_9ARAC|nr:putative RNA-directed DNA polymerase from transposon X-element [Trichonephila inaurata madagascariensis]
MEPRMLTRPSTPTPTKICSQLQQLAKEVDQYSTFVRGQQFTIDALKASGIYDPDNPYVKELLNRLYEFTDLHHQALSEYSSFSPCVIDGCPHHDFPASTPVITISDTQDNSNDFIMENENSHPTKRKEKSDGLLRLLLAKLVNLMTFNQSFKLILQTNLILYLRKRQKTISLLTRVPGSKIFRLVCSFPPTKENYSKDVQQVKERLGREDLLVQIYVRDLLGLVMQNATGKIKLELSELYDVLKSKLLALESLGRTQEKFTDFLEPLVESCLPEAVLRVWERCRNADPTSEGQGSGRSLDRLMTFLCKEVELEEMILLARTGLGSTQRQRIKATAEAIFGYKCCSRQHKRRKVGQAKISFILLSMLTGALTVSLLKKFVGK